MNAQDHPDALAIEGIKSEHWFFRNNRWYGTVYDEHTGQEYDVRETPFGWNVNDDKGRDHHRHELEHAITEARRTHMDDEVSEALSRLAMGDMLMLTIPRDDFAKLMALVAQIEENDLDEHGVVELSRIASDLNQQADAQD